MSKENAMLYLGQVHDLLQKAKRDAPNGVTITHTFTTPEYIEIGQRLLDVQYAIEDIIEK